MRHRVSVALVLALVLSAVVLPAVSFAEEWIEFIDQSERFGVNLPGKPAVEETKYTSWRGVVVPAKVYTVADGPRKYLVTVVNYNVVTINTDGDRTDILGAVDWAAWNIRKRPGIQITYDAYAQADRIAGHEIYYVNPDKTQTFVGMFLHGKRLYQLEATVPGGTPPPLQFQQSLEIFDDQGVRIRYELNDEGQRVGRVRGDQ